MWLLRHIHWPWMPRKKSEPPKPPEDPEIVRLLRRILHTQEKIMAFIDDATAALKTQADAIDALGARLPGPTDPATIVPVADQQLVLSGIAANTDKVNALAPKA